MLWFYLNSLLTLHFTNRTKMEGHAIHSKSCLHFQQDEEHVCADNSVWKTSGWLLGGMYQGQKHESGRLQDRKRQVLSYHNAFPKFCSSPSLTRSHSRVQTKYTHTHTHRVLYSSSPPHPHHTRNYCGLGKSCSTSWFLNYPILQLPLVRARPYSFLSCPYYSSHWCSIKLYPFLDCSILQVPMGHGRLYLFLNFPIWHLPLI